MGATAPHALALTTLAGALCLLACGDRNPASLEVARAPIDPLVFDDGYGDDVYFQAFAGTHLTAVSIDSTYAYAGYVHDGARSLRVDIPPSGSSLGLFSGGVLTAAASRDLADFDALGFYARADSAIQLDVVGFGNDNTGTSIHDAGLAAIAIGPAWSFHVIPIPAPSKLIAERGLFLFTESLEEEYPRGYSVWFDEIRFLRLDDLELVSGRLPSSRRTYFTGTTADIGDCRTLFRRGESYLDVLHGASYFDYSVSDPKVATINRLGRIETHGAGESSITATLRGNDAVGKIIVTGVPAPTISASNPTVAPSKVISLFSDAYDDANVDTWRADGKDVTTQVSDYAIGGNPVKMYTTLNWVGIEFFHPTLDLSSMEFMHLDLFGAAGTQFRVKLVSFTEDLSDFAESVDITFDATSTPAYQTGVWLPLEIPLSDFDVPPTFDWSRVGELVIASTDAKLVLLDNVYWHQ